VRLSSRIQDKLQQLPDRPGVYIMRDRAGRVIYVGKASSLRKRVRWYFRQATLKSADPKLRGLVKSVHDLSFIICRSEAEAALTEGRLIKDFRPRYNVQFRDDKRFLMLKVNLSDPFPRFSTCRVRKNDSAEYFGPYPSSKVARTALDFVEKRYGLRRCRSLIPDEEDRKHCLNETIRYCSAPCIGRISRDEYLSRVHAACQFLRGERAEDLEALHRAMMKAAEQQDFEKAAALRDLWLRLREALRDRRSHVRRLRYSREEGLQGIEELQRALGLKKLPVVIEAFDISHISGTLAVGSMVSSEHGVPRPERYRRYRIRVSQGRDDTAMLGEVIGRRYRRLLSEGRPLPDLILVDGGAPQLAAARRVLNELGLQEMPVAGLAKRLEELYSENTRRPVRLRSDSAGLHVIQWLRDEAHRFALNYHRALRSKKIRESILDEIPGIGQERKRRLLEFFGDIRSLAQADVEMIQRVPGFGAVLAAYLKRELARLMPGITAESTVTQGKSE